MTEATCARLHQIVELSHKYDTHTNARIRELVMRIFMDEGAVCPDCDGRGEVLDAPGNVLAGRTYWTPCPTCSGTKTEAYEFIECDHCRVKPGSPLLCAGCQHNRTAMEAAARELAARERIIEAYESQLARMEKRS